MRLFLPLFCLTAICAVGCGTPGAPLPPSLGIPKPVGDLQAVRKGNTVTLTWSAPTETTDGALIRKPGKMLLARTISFESATRTVIADLPLEPSLKQGQAPAPTAKDSLTSLRTTGDFAVYSVVAASNSGKNAGPSNQVIVSLVPAVPPPQRVGATAVPLGISLSWDQFVPLQNQTHLSVQYAYRILRRQEGANATPVMIKELSAGNEAMIFVDAGIDWQQHYEYWITPVTLWQGTSVKGEVEGDDSPVASVFADDKFPPAAPAGLQAVFSGLAQQPFITSSFRDARVSPGMKYFYLVSAVDLRGNESDKSPETSETVPKE